VAAEAEGTNGTTSPVDLRSQILSSIPDEDAAEVQAETVEVDADEEATEETVEAAADEAEPVDDEDAETEDSDEEAVADPKAAKGLDAVRKAEKRHREKMEADRAEFAAEREKHKESLSELANFKEMAKRAKYDPVPVLRALGLTEDDLTAVAHAVYAESKEGAADPKRRDAAARQLREREKEDKLTATEKRIQDLEAKLERKEQEATERAAVEQFVSEATAAAKAKAPLIAHYMAHDPDTYNAGVFAAYGRLEKAGKKPTPTAVIAEYDRHERARLTKLGIDPNTIAKAKAASAKTATTKPVATKSNGHGTLSKEEILAQLAASD
jgi:hypothetical protein